MNRVSTIQQISGDNLVVWHHCPEQNNPADIVSRGATVNQLKDRIWLHGPQWLSSDLWPVERLTSTVEEVKEVRVQAVLATPDKNGGFNLPNGPELLGWFLGCGRGSTDMMKCNIFKRAEQVLFKIVQ